VARLKADLVLMLVALIWGSTFVLVKQALDSISTMLFLTLRFGIAAAALAIIFRGRGSRRGRRREWMAGAVVGCFLFAGYCLQTTGLKYTTPSKAGFITGFYIVLVPLFSAVIYRRAPQAAELAGVGVATAGMCLLTNPSLRLDIGFGDVLVLASAVSYAFHILALGRFSTEMSYEGLSVSQIATGAVLGASSFWWLERPHIVLNSSVVVALLITSLFATAFAFSVQSWAQQFTTPTRTALIFALEPVFAWLAADALIGEVLTPKAASGAVLILAGILLVELKPARLGRHQSPRQGVSL
jgi:drug/metabolite transporter (DMT)-like permease